MRGPLRDDPRVPAARIPNHAAAAGRHTLAQSVVARYQDGRVLKGVSMDIDPAKPVFHVRPQQGPVVEVKLSDLKALFFVRSLAGNPEYSDVPRLDPADPRARGSIPVRLTFADGEVMLGLTFHFPPNRPYFFVTPVDPKSNNIRVLVNRAALKEIDQLAAS